MAAPFLSLTDDGELSVIFGDTNTIVTVYNLPLPTRIEVFDSPELDFFLHLHLSNGNDGPLQPLSRLSRRLSSGSTSRLATGAKHASRDPVFEVDWEDVDKENSKQWPVWYRAMILGFVSFSTMTV